MKRHAVWIAIAIAAVCLTGAPSAQSTTKAKPAPRAANGKPDFSGIWIATGALRLMAGEAELAAARKADVDEGRPFARHRRLSASAGDGSLLARCLGHRVAHPLLNPS